MCPGARPEGWLRCSAHPFVVLSAGDMHSTLLLLPTPGFSSRFFRSGSWVFWSFCIFWSRICPNCVCTQLFLVACNFFVFCCSRRGLSRCKHCSTVAKGPSLSHSDWLSGASVQPILRYHTGPHKHSPFLCSDIGLFSSPCFSVNASFC